MTAQGVLIAAVSDGAGSAARSEEGSLIAVQAAMTTLSDSLATTSFDPDAMEQAMKYAVHAAWEAIAQHADQEQEPIAAFHATLICVAIADDLLTVGHIGDGVAVTERADDCLETIARPEHGEYANSTFFVTQLPDLPDKLHIRSIRGPLDAIALSTDGLLEVAFREPYGPCEPWGEFFTPLFGRVRQASPETDLTAKLTSLLGSAKIRSQTSDDVSLVIAVRRSEVEDLKADTQLNARDDNTNHEVNEVNEPPFVQVVSEAEGLEDITAVDDHANAAP